MDQAAAPPTTSNLGKVFLLGVLIVGIAVFLIVRRSPQTPVSKPLPPATQTTVEESPAPEVAPASERQPVPVLPPRVVPRVPVRTATDNSFPARHQAAWGRACNGRLSLTPQFLIFQCPGKIDLILPRQALRNDRNGIRVISGGKAYHFSLPGKSYAEVKALFAAWAAPAAH